jgi:uncharacterized protein YndB with AHSA1/START domain
MTSPQTAPNELSITRHIAAPRAAVWRCWTQPGLLMQWYCPRPWRVVKADIDLRPGGRADITMQGPEGDAVDHTGCYLEVVPMERIVFTDAFTEGFAPKPDPFMVGFVRLSDAAEGGTRMVWGARHWSAEDKAKHEAMGFHAGWSAAADQLDDLARQVAAESGADA